MKVLIIAKYADPVARQLLGRKLEDFVLQDSIYDTYTGKELGVAECYEEIERPKVELLLEACRKLNPTVGYDIVTVERT